MADSTYSWEIDVTDEEEPNYIPYIVAAAFGVGLLLFLWYRRKQ